MKKENNGIWENNADISWIDSSKPMMAFTFDDGPVGTADTSTSVRIQNAFRFLQHVHLQTLRHSVAYLYH